MNVSTVRLTLAGIRYTVRAGAWGTPGADAAMLAVLRRGAARRDVRDDLCRLASAQLHRPVAPAELESTLILLGRRGRIVVACEPILMGAAPAAVAPAGHREVMHSQPVATETTPTTLRVVNDAGQSFEGQPVTLVRGDSHAARQRLVSGALWVDREGGPVQWRLSVDQRGF